MDVGVDADLDLGGALDAGVDAGLDLGLVDATLDTVWTSVPAQST